MDVKGFHIIADLSQCQEISKFDNEENLVALLLHCAQEANATVLSVKTHKFEPEGISAFVFLAESHISVHVWTTQKYASLDCYTCGDTTNPRKTVEAFSTKVKPLYHTITEVRRGVPKVYIQNCYTHEVDSLGFANFIEK